MSTCLQSKFLFFWFSISANIGSVGARSRRLARQKFPSIDYGFVILQNNLYVQLQAINQM